MQAALDLVKVNQATHTAIRNGRWDDPRTWKGGKIPTTNSKVHIPANLTVTYGTLNSVRHDTVRVDGTLKFATTQSSKLLLDTMVVTMSGELQIGTRANPVAANKTVDIVFNSNSNITQNGDPQKLRRGLLSMGKASIVGSEKLDHIKLKRNALAGDRVLVLDLPRGMTQPQGWQRGDRLVLGGTQYAYNGSHDDNSRSQDEVLEITAINGNRISFRNVDIQEGPRDVLRFDHKLPDVAEKDQLNLYVANTSRNVTFSSENREQTPIGRRGHTMFMNNPDVEIRNAGFVGLGRSDKTKLVDDPVQNVDGSPGQGSNPRGRYSLHLHRMENNTYGGQPAIISGNAVVNNPGWGIVAHSSKANISDNVIFDVVGSGLVAEGGDEQGRWQNNIVIKTTGVDWRDAERTRDDRDRLFDHGFRGDGYWIQGAGQVTFKDNIAISSHQTGLTIFGDTLNPDDDFRDAPTIAVKDLPPAIRKLVAKPGQNRVDVTDVPLKEVKGLESYNGNIGFKLWGHMTNFDGETEFSSPDPTTAHNLRSTVSDLKLWGNRWRGMQVQYSTQVDFNNGLVIGDLEDPDRIGVDNNHAAFNNRFKNYTIQGFEQGFKVPLNGPDNRERDYLKSTLSNSTFRQNLSHLSPTRRESDSVLGDDFPSDMVFKNNQFSSQAGNQAPIANFSTRAVGGLTLELDAKASQDPDPIAAEGAGPRSSRGIAAYGWDFNQDGRIDATGRTTTYTFPNTGSQRINLTVWDAQGKTSTIQKRVEVAPSPFQNPFVDSTFNQAGEYLEGWKANNRWAGEGWFATPGVTRNRSGFAVLSNPSSWGTGIGQVVQNNQTNRGEQTFQFSLQNIEGAKPNEYWLNNTITVNLWGINGQFNNSGWETDGPERVGALPMNARKVFSRTIGGRQKIGDRDSFDWKNFSHTVDLGQGYEFLLVQVNTAATRDAGDRVAIDNISLTGAAGGSTGNNPTPSAIVGTAAANRLVGTNRNDTISGRGGNDLLVGKAGSDLIRGDAGNDRLKGSGAKARETDIDTLVGGSGQDQFILGSNRGSFYLNDRKSGNASYAWIEDFSLSQDQLKLNGDVSEYQFRSMTLKGSQGTAIFLQEENGNDLVAFVKGVMNPSALQSRL